MHFFTIFVDIMKCWLFLLILFFGEQEGGKGEGRGKVGERERERIPVDKPRVVLCCGP